MQITAEIKAQRASVEAVRKSFVGPLNESVKRINAFFKPADTMYANAEAYLKDKILGFRRAQDAERERLMLEAQRHAVAGQTRMTEQSISRIEATVLPEIKNLSTRVDWVGEVFDAHQIPREFMIPDVGKLLAVTRATRGDPRIPGWRAYSKDTAIVRQQ